MIQNKNRDTCYLTGCEYNTGLFTNKCKIKQVDDDGGCRYYRNRNKK